MEQQVAQVIGLAQGVITEMNNLRQTMEQQLAHMKSTLDAEAARKAEVVMKSELPGLRTSMMQDLGDLMKNNFMCPDERKLLIMWRQTRDVIRTGWGPYYLVPDLGTSRKQA